MFGAISSAFSMAGAMTNATTSWLSTIAALACTVVLWRYEDQISSWVRNTTANKFLKLTFAPGAARFVVFGILSFAAIWLASLVSSIGILQPGLLVGYTPGSPFQFGRYIATLSRSANTPDSYCPHLQVIGSVVNSTSKTIAVWYAGDPINVSSRNPSVDYNNNVQISNIGRSGGGYSLIEPNQGLKIAFSAYLNPTLCKDFTASDLDRLRQGRISVSTGIHMKDPSLGGEPLISVVFEDLPIASY